MRLVTLKRGYSLNEYCISDKKTKNQLHQMKLIRKLVKQCSKKEDIFKFIDLDYVDQKKGILLLYQK